MLILPAVIAFGFQVFQLLLHAGELFGVRLVLRQLAFQAIDCVGVCLNDGVHLFLRQPHALQQFSCQCDKSFLLFIFPDIASGGLAPIFQIVIYRRSANSGDF